MMRIIAIRTDASGEIGSGHVMRCLTLANELARRGARIAFICREITPALQQMVQQAGHEVLILPPAPQNDPPNDGPTHAAWLKAHWRSDAEHTAAVLREMGSVDWLIVDHYALDARWEALLHPHTQRIMVIDDLADRKHDCDLLLDVTLGRTRQDYAGLVPDEAQLLLGPRYALLRPEFLRLRPSAMQKRKQGGLVQRILVSFGGSDPDGLSATTLRAIAEVAPADVHVDVALGATSPEALGLPAIAANMPQQVVFHGFSTDMAQLMHDADLAIGAGGQSSWERCCLGLPTIIVCTANNQRENAAALEHEGAALITNTNKLIQALPQLLPENARQSMSQSASRLCHGDGTWLVATQLMPATLKDGKHLSLAPLSHAHSELVYRWQHEPGMRRYFHNPQPPAREEHERWLASFLRDPSRMGWVLQVDGQFCGLLRLEFASTEKAEISILVSASCRRLGLAKAALQLLEQHFSHVYLLAWVHEENQASLHLFTGLGFQPGERREDGFQAFARPPSEGSPCQLSRTGYSHHE